MRRPSRDPRWRAVCLAALAFVLAADGLGPAAAWAEEASGAGPATVRKSVKGLHFQLPPDWPVEERGGITAPIPIEEYLATKFKTLESRLQILEQQLSSLDIRLRVLEERVQRPRQELRSTDPGSVEPSGP